MKTRNAAPPKKARRAQRGTQPRATAARLLEFRVFLSYSHDDRKQVETVKEVLQQNHLQPMLDQHFQYGRGFHAQIRNFIAHAHVFLPLLTEGADTRKWVHQEIGYAVALGVPVLPLAIGAFNKDTAMLREIHAIHFTEPPQRRELRKALSYQTFERLVRQKAESDEPLYQCAEFAGARARLMAAYANDVYDLGFYDVVRQKGALSSFHIPRYAITHPDWELRYGLGKHFPGKEHCRLLRAERIALERHARQKGCRLIIDPYLGFKKYGPDAQRSRLQPLVEFLKSLPDSLCAVAINKGMPAIEDVTILGDWFAAESVSAKMGQGYRQTIFTRHAPTLLTKIENFDQEFDDLLRRWNWRRRDSRRLAINEIRKLIAQVEGEIAKAVPKTAAEPARTRG